MSMAWEVSAIDISTVLNAHYVDYDEDRLQELLDTLDTEAIEDSVLNYTDFDDQCSSALDAIENALIEQGVITGQKKYLAP